MSATIQQMAVAQMAPAERGLAEWKKSQDHQATLKAVGAAVTHGDMAKAKAALSKLSSTYPEPLGPVGKMLQAVRKGDMGAAQIAAKEAETMRASQSARASKQAVDGQANASSAQNASNALLNVKA